jgi:hypothetical protein
MRPGSCPGWRLRGDGRHSVTNLYDLWLGREDQLEPVYERLREFGVKEPEQADEVLERLYGRPSMRRLNSYRERRKELLLTMLDRYGDSLDRAAQELGSLFDYLRQVGVRGLVASKLNDRDFSLPPEVRDKLPPEAERF